MYRYGIKNAFRPSSVGGSSPYGWTTAPAYNRADVPTGLMDQPAALDENQFRQQFAYEWLDSGSMASSASSQNAGEASRWNLSNPPFVSGAAGRLHPALQQAGTSQPARILRGFIRRAQYEAGDDLSKSRLYFMYNPEVISRDYVSYLEQGALDPFNTVYQSGNLVAPPSILDFSFELFFDRQEEATQLNHPGVFVDYQYFDLVVRNVVPTAPGAGSTSIPDNGVMMVNPRDITVVFSPQMTIQGRPLNARVTFERFTHRMTPTRMRIALTMRAVYMGPLREVTQYTAEAFAAQAAVSFGETEPWKSMITIGEIEFIKTGEYDISEDTFGGGDFSDSVENSYAEQEGTRAGANSAVRLKALDWAKAHTNENTKYNAEGAARYNLPTSADCSGLVVAAYKGIGANVEVFGSDAYLGTGEMLSTWQSNGFRGCTKFSRSQCNTELTKGDLLIRPKGNGHKTGHVMFFESYREGGGVNVFAAHGGGHDPQVGPGGTDNLESTYIGVSPRPVGVNMNSNASNAATSRNQAV